MGGPSGSDPQRKISRISCRFLSHLVFSRQLWQLDHGAPVERVLGRQDDAVARHQPLERARLLPVEAALGRLVQVHRPRPGPKRLQLRQRGLREGVAGVVGPHHAEGVILQCIL